jgi:hypothetical protein
MRIQTGDPLDRWSEFYVNTSRPVVNLAEVLDTSYVDLVEANWNGWNEAHSWFLLRDWQSSLDREFAITLPPGSVEVSGRVTYEDVVLPVPYRELGAPQAELDFAMSSTSAERQPEGCQAVGCLSSSPCQGAPVEEEMAAALLDVSAAEHLVVRSTTSGSGAMLEGNGPLVQVMGRTSELEPELVSEDAWTNQNYDVSDEELVGVVLGAGLTCSDSEDGIHFDGVFVE